MKTIEEKITERLVNNGLWPDEAKAVMELVKKAPENESMQGRWSENAEYYPQQIMAMAWFSAKNHAIEWIDSNFPNHFARSMFENKQDKQ